MKRTGTTALSGWPIVGWCSLVLVVLMAALLAAYGTDEAGVRVVVRMSAKTSLLLFMSAFVASAAYQLWPGAQTRWLLANRRYVGVSFAVSHFIHLLTLVALARVSTEFAASLNALTLIGGGMAYVFIAAMVATSFDRTAAWLGPRAWRRLHVVGLYYIWGIFFNSYLPRAIMSPAYIPFALVLAAGLGVRIVAWRRRRQRPAFRAVQPASAG